MQQNELSHASDTFIKANKEANNSRYFIVVWLIVIIVLTLLIGSYIDQKYRRFHFTCQQRTARIFRLSQIAFYRRGDENSYSVE